jgi:serine/threonine protein kinase
MVGNRAAGTSPEWGVGSRLGNKYRGGTAVSRETGPVLPDSGMAGKIADYRLSGYIGRGGMAVVYLAQDERVDRTVALKILAPELAQDAAFRNRFLHESRAAAAVDHPNIVPVYEVGDAGANLFVAMRYVQGGDTRALLNRVGPLPFGWAWSIIAQIASALDAAHAHGLIHRDVKPTNMLLESDDHVYLSDFGITKNPPAGDSAAALDQIVGTPDYVAPEQVEGRAVDGRADLYSLACAGFELLCGTPPFGQDQGLTVMYAQLYAPPPMASARRPDLPPAVDQVLATALAKNPADRYMTCGQFAEELHSALRLVPGDAYADHGYEPAPPTTRGPFEPAPPTVRGPFEPAPPTVRGAFEPGAPTPYEPAAPTGPAPYEPAPPTAPAPYEPASATWAGPPDPAPHTGTGPGPYEPVLPAEPGSYERVLPVEPGPYERVLPVEPGLYEPVLPAEPGPYDPALPTGPGLYEPGPPAAPALYGADWGPPAQEQPHWPGAQSMNGPGWGGPPDGPDWAGSGPASRPGPPSRTGPPRRTGPPGRPGGTEQRPPHQPISRTRKIAAAVGTAVVVVAVVIAAALSLSKHPSSNSSAPHGSSSPPASSTTSALASRQADKVNSLLASSAATRKSLVVPIRMAGNCRHLPRDVAQIQRVLNQRSSEYRKVQALATGAMLKGALVKADLLSALRRSMDADRAYLTWARQQMNSGCTPTSQSSAYQAAQNADTQADAAKAAFVQVWDSVAARYGLPQKSPGDI